MTNRLRYAFALLAFGLPAALNAAKPDPACPEPVKASLFISPMGEPFRPASDNDDPVKRWFDQADRDHDGRLTIGEMMLDGDRFFGTLDKDHNDELLPDEVGAYEQNVAPEVRLYQRRPSDEGEGGHAREGGDPPQGGGHGGSGRHRARPGSGDSGVEGAGRYAFLNIPNPVASADDDINRAVSKAEFRAAAADRFRALDPDQKKALVLADLPKTPAQIAANVACVARVKDEARDGRNKPR